MAKNIKRTYKNMHVAVKEFSYGNPNKKGLLKFKKLT